MAVKLVRDRKSTKLPRKGRGGGEVQQLSLLNAELTAKPTLDPDYLHTVLTSVFLPVSDPGDQSVWRRRDGKRSLLVEAGVLPDDSAPEGYVRPGLPYGAKARLVLIYLTGEAVRTRSNIIDVGRSMRAFMAAMGLTDGGREYEAVHEQLRRLRAASIHLSLDSAEKSSDMSTRLVEGAEFWHRDGEGRGRWEDRVVLGSAFFEALRHHSVPLDPTHVRALAGSALALDVYSWLAGRLHRVAGAEFIPWARLWDQFAVGWKDTPANRRRFRGNFRRVLTQVASAYDAVHDHVEDDDLGLTLTAAPPPVPKLTFLS